MNGVSATPITIESERQVSQGAERLAAGAQE
jgi:hypothetical protein